MSRETESSSSPTGSRERRIRASRGALSATRRRERPSSTPIASGRLPPAWLIGGPPGHRQGDARLSRRAAAPRPSGRARIESVDGPRRRMPAHPRRAAGRALSRIPTSLVLRRTMPDGRQGAPHRRSPLDAVRRAVELFGSTAGEGGWRVVHRRQRRGSQRASANALLKLIEEPPRARLFLIVAHAPRAACCRRSARAAAACCCARSREAEVGTRRRQPRARPGRMLRTRSAAAAARARRRLGAADARAPRRRHARLRRAGRTASLDALPRHDLRAVLALAETLAAPRRGGGLRARRSTRCSAGSAERLRREAGAGRAAPCASRGGMGQGRARRRARSKSTISTAGRSSWRCSTISPRRVRRTALSRLTA